MSHRPRKRFGQKYYPVWFIYVFCGVKEAGMNAAGRIVSSFSPLQRPCPIKDVCDSIELGLEQHAYPGLTKCFSRYSKNRRVFAGTC